MRYRVAAAGLVTAACLAGAGPSAQQAPVQAPPAVTYAVQVNYVEVDAFVTDAAGTPVTDLQAADFEVLEDGAPQTVASFARVDIPIEKGERPLFSTDPIEADVQSNEAVEGRVYLLVLDDLHTEVTHTPRVRDAARRFVERSFGDNDLAAVIYTSGRVRDAQDFTNNRRLLLRAIDRFTGRKLTSATVEQIRNAALNDTTNRIEPGPDPGRTEREWRARAVMSTVRKAAEFMAGVRGRRKAMLLIGEGIEYNLTESVDLPQSSTPVPGATTSATAALVRGDTQDAIAAATRGNVTIYAIDPRGLLTGTEELITAGRTFEDQGVGSTSILNERRNAQASLQEMAARTGGFAALNRNEMNTAFDRIVAENSSYYMLGYHADNGRREGRFRRIEVRVKRPGVRVRARSGYYEARGRAPESAPMKGTDGLPPALVAGLNSPIPISGLPLKVFAAPFKGNAPNAAVALAIEVDVSKLSFVEKAGLFTDGLEVAIGALDADGKALPGERHTVGLNFKPDTYARARERGVRVLSRHALPPGRYQLRVAAANTAGTVSGAVLYDIDIPDFYRAPLSMSGVAITSTRAAQVPTIKAHDPLRDYLPAPPTAVREFGRDEAIAIFAEFYENARGLPAHQVVLRAELRADGGRVVREATQERSSTEIKGAGGYGFSPRLLLQGLEPGLYVLRIEGQARIGDRPAVSRDIQIRIR